MKTTKKSKVTGKRKIGKNEKEKPIKGIGKADLPFKASSVRNAAFRGVNKEKVLPEAKKRKLGPKSGQKTAIKRGLNPHSGSSPHKPVGKAGSSKGPLQARKPVGKAIASPQARSTGKGKPGSNGKLSGKPIKPIGKTKPVHHGPFDIPGEKVNRKTEFRWYVIYLKPDARDKKMRTKIIKDRIKEGLSRLIRKCVSVRFESHEFRNGAPIVMRRARFPGYLLLECKLTDEVKSFIMTMKGVQCILMSPEQIVDLESQEAAEIMLSNDLVKAKQKQDRLKPVEEKLPVGTPVIVNRKIGEPWHLTEGTVIRSETGENIVIEFELMGQKHQLDFPFHQLVKRSEFKPPANEEQ